MNVYPNNLLNWNVSKTVSEIQKHQNSSVAIQVDGDGHVGRDDLDGKIHSLSRSSIAALHDKSSDMRIEGRFNGVKISSSEVFSCIPLLKFVPPLQCMGCTSLTFAVMRRDVHMVRCLHKFGAHFNMNDYGGRTPLMLAVFSDDMSMVCLLVRELGADLNLFDASGRTPLTLAVLKRNVSMVRLLHSLGANINMSDKRGITPLGMAIIQSDADMIKALYELKVHVSLVDGRGFTPIVLAAIKGVVPIVDLLLSFPDVAVDVCDDIGWTPLMRTLVLHNDTVSSCLVAHGANVDLAKKLLLVLEVAQTWSMRGTDEGSIREDHSCPLNLECMCPSESVLWLSRTLHECLSQAPKIFMDEIGENISATIDDLLSVIQHQKDIFFSRRIFAKIQTKKPTVLIVSAENHVISMVFANDKIYVLNKGLGMTEHAIEVYACSTSRITPWMIDQVWQPFPSIQSFQYFFMTYFAPFRLEDEGFDMKPQKVGNCSWANTKLLVFLLEYLFLETTVPDRQQRILLCKEHYTN